MSDKKWVFILLALITALAIAQPARAAQGAASVTVYYFYDNPCASCNEEGKFNDKLNSAVGNEKQGVELQVLCFNTFHTADEDKFNSTCEKLNIPKEKRVTPMVIINGTVLAGQEEIDSSLGTTFSAEKQKALEQAAATDPSASRPVYFYVSPCDECAAVKDYLANLPKTYAVEYNGRQFDSTLFIDSYNIAEPQNLELVKKYFKSYNVPDSKQKVPIIFLRDGYLSGKEEITIGLQPAIRAGRCIDIAQLTGRETLKPYEWPAILLTGLVNGFNPCSISMLLLLITLLLARKASVLKLGMLFIVGKFIAYMALGTLLFSMLEAIDNSVVKNVTAVIKYILLAVVLAVAAINISDFFAAKNENYNKVRLQLPVGLRRLNHKWLKGISTIADGPLLLLLALALGMAISVGEFLCTGQIYLATIIYLLKRSTELNLQTLTAFLVYVIGMLLPLIVITLAVHKGKALFNVSELARKNMPLIKLVSAVVFIAFAVIIVIWF